MILDRAAILAAQDRKTEVVNVPEWGGGDVIVKAMSSAERDSWESWCTEQRERWGKYAVPNIRASLVVRSLVDEKGERVFGDSEVELLGEKSGAALDRIFAVAGRLSKITEKDVEELKKV